MHFAGRTHDFLKLKLVVSQPVGGIPDNIRNKVMGFSRSTNSTVE